MPADCVGTAFDHGHGVAILIVLGVLNTIVCVGALYVLHRQPHTVTDDELRLIREESLARLGASVVALVVSGAIEFEALKEVATARFGAWKAEKP